MALAPHSTEDYGLLKNLEIVQAAYDAAQRGDVASLGGLAHPDLAVQAAESLPYGGSFRGSEAFAQATAAFARLWDQPQIEVEQILGGGDRVVALLRLSARHRASGRPFVTRLIEVWQIRDGQVVEILSFYWDTAAIIALGRTNHYLREPAY